VNDRPTLLDGTSGTLEDLLLRLLADTHKRGPGRYPICPVCDQPMAVEVEVDLLRCPSCHSSLADALDDERRLLLVA
jgi:hypothetical protein